MLLGIVVGNTTIKIGVFDGEKLVVDWHIATEIHRLPDEYAIILFNLLHNQGLNPAQVKEFSIGSVVPTLTMTFEEIAQRYFNVTPLVVRAGVKTGIRLRMDNPREVGADRIINAAAATQLYGGPVIVVDMGTGVVFDTVSKDGDYLGGAIAPGIGIASEALFSRAAQLYRVQLIAPRKVIGTNTIAAIQSGLIYGYAGLVEGIVGRIQQELGVKARVIGTGGYSALIAKETKVFDLLNPFLTLTGLRLITLMNKTP